MATAGPSVLLPALAAAVVARMESLPVALGAGVGLGIIQQVVRWNSPNTPSLTDLAFLVVIVVALLALFAARDAYVRWAAARHGIDVDDASLHDSPDLPNSSVSVAENATLTLENGETLLSCGGIDAAYGPVQILFGVDFAVRRGEIVALLGTNGAGKSTLLKVVCGLLPATRGSVCFDGSDLVGLPADVLARLALSLMTARSSCSSTSCRWAWPRRLDVSLREAAAIAPDVVERPSVLACRDVVKRFGGITAVDHVDLDLRDGEILGLRSGTSGREASSPMP